MAEERVSVPRTPTTSERVGGVRTRGGRLPPARSRDLGQPTRRTFTPNIPQRRVKVKEEKSQPEESIQSSSSNNENKSNRRDRGRGRGRGRKEYIQVSGSLFGQGVGEDITLKKETRDVSCLKDSSIVKPVFTMKKQKSKKEQIEDEKRYFGEDDFDSDSDGNEDISCPIILPLKKSIKTEIKAEKDVKPQIKKEKEDVEMLENEMEQKINKKEDVKNEKPVIKSEDILDMFTHTDVSGKLFLLQYPNNLFSEIGTENNPAADAQEPSTNETETKKTDVNSLKSVKEGLVGKLQIYKSGAIKLVCGDTVFDMDQKELINFSEELVMMKGSNESDIEVVNFGKINRHLVIYPPIENLSIE